MTLMLLALWAATHRYHGLSRDGSLYAVQALSQIEPALRADLYLQNTSQDQFTIFSPIYAEFIRLFGLQTGELILFGICQVGFLVAIGMAARQLPEPETALLSVGLFIITVGYYGAYKIFAYSENYLSARSLGEAMVAAAVAVHLRGWRWQGLLLALLALFIHPLMALPGVLLLICLDLPVLLATLLMVTAVFASFAVASLAIQFPITDHFFSVMDPRWLEVVRQRSQFLFLQYWNRGDWEMAARPVIGLFLSLRVLQAAPARKLCVAAMLIGASGLAIAAIAGDIGPVAILLQGQAWRWMWVTTYISVLLVVPTAAALVREERGGPLAAVLLVAAWVLPAVDSLVLAGPAVVLWLNRRSITPSAAVYLRWAAGAGLLLVTGWIIAKSWTYLHGPLPESVRESTTVARFREIFGLVIPAAACAAIAWNWMTRSRSLFSTAAVTLCSLGVCYAFLPGSLQQPDRNGTPAQIAEFADWRLAIPPESTVLILPPPKSAAFIWFTLGRPSYLSVDQSSGVVFSPATSEEIRRRSTVLLPVAKPDWQILTELMESSSHNGNDGKLPAVLTAQKLSTICRDSKLGFVIAKENVGFDPLRHAHGGAFKDWNLYDCDHVRATPSTT